MFAVSVVGGEWRGSACDRSTLPRGQHALDFFASRGRGLRPHAGHGDGGGGVGKARRFGQRFAFRQGHGQRAAEDVSGGRGVNSIDFVSRNQMAETFSGNARSAGSQRDDHVSHSSRKQLRRGPFDRRPVGRLYASQQFRFAFVGGQHGDALEQAGRQPLGRSGIKDDTQSGLGGQFRRGFDRFHFRGLQLPGRCTPGITKCLSRFFCTRVRRGQFAVRAGRNRNAVFPGAAHEDKRDSRRAGSIPNHMINIDSVRDETCHGLVAKRVAANARNEGHSAAAGAGGASRPGLPLAAGCAGWNLPPRMVSPGLGRRSTLMDKSVFELPTTRTDGAGFNGRPPVFLPTAGRQWWWAAKCLPSFAGAEIGFDQIIV